jgi:hypothetical protein
MKLRMCKTFIGIIKSRRMRGTVCSTDIKDESQESLCTHTKKDKTASLFVLCLDESERRFKHLLQLTLNLR